MSGLQGRVDVTQFRDLVGKASRLDPALKRELRKRIRAAAMRAAAAARQEVQQPPSSPGASGQSTGLRSEIAAGIKVRIMAGKQPGIAIVSSASSTAHPASIVKAYDSPNGWRHPDYGHEPWIQQTGRPYFASVIGRYRDDVTKSVAAAMQEALKTLE